MPRSFGDGRLADCDRSFGTCAKSRRSAGKARFGMADMKSVADGAANDATPKPRKYEYSEIGAAISEIFDGGRGSSFVPCFGGNMAFSWSGDFR